MNVACVRASGEVDTFETILLGIRRQGFRPNLVEICEQLLEL